MKKFKISKNRLINRNMIRQTFSNKTYLMIVFYINLNLPSSKFVLICYFYSSGRAVEKDTFFSLNMFNGSFKTFSVVKSK